MKREIEILLNGKNTVIPAVYSVEDLIGHLELKRDQVAVEVNRLILRRESWAEHSLQAGDIVEIVHFVGGGKEE